MDKGLYARFIVAIVIRYPTFLVKYYFPFQALPRSFMRRASNDFFTDSAIRMSWASFLIPNSLRTGFSICE